MAQQKQENPDDWTPEEKITLREHLRALHSSLGVKGPCPPIFEDVPSPPRSPAVVADGVGKQHAQDRCSPLFQNPVHQENLRIRQRNLFSTLCHLDAKLEPLLDIETGKAIAGFPKTLRDIDRLGHDEGVRILKAAGELDVSGDEHDVLYHVRRCAATRPIRHEVPGEGEGDREYKYAAV